MVSHKRWSMTYKLEKDSIMAQTTTSITKTNCSFRLKRHSYISWNQPSIFWNLLPHIGASFSWLFSSSFFFFLVRRPRSLAHLILLINFCWQGTWLMMVKRIESRLGKTGPKKQTAGLMETNVSTEIYDGPSFLPCQVITRTGLL